MCNFLTYNKLKCIHILDISQSLSGLIDSHSFCPFLLLAKSHLYVNKFHSFSSLVHLLILFQMRYNCINTPQCGQATFKIKRFSCLLGKKISIKVLINWRRASMGPGVSLSCSLASWHCVRGLRFLLYNLYYFFRPLSYV